MRNADTYRGARRNEHRNRKTSTTWADWNALDGDDQYDVGSVTSGYRPGHVARSKYPPHIGAKERGRHLASA